MRNIDFECKYQADLFEYASKIKDCSSAFFIKQFAYSKVAKRMDDELYIFLADDVTKAYNSLKTEKKLTIGTDVYPPQVISWIGYIMRYMAIKYNYSTKYIYSFVKPKELYGLYEAYHSMDNDLACQRIIESKKIENKLNNMELLKKIYQST